MLEFERCFMVGGEQDCEWRTMADLGVELACGAEGQGQLVTCLALKVLGNELHGRHEVRRHRHTGLGGIKPLRCEQGQDSDPAQ